MNRGPRSPCAPCFAAFSSFDDAAPPHLTTLAPSCDDAAPAARRRGRGPGRTPSPLSAAARQGSCTENRTTSPLLLMSRHRPHRATTLHRAQGREHTDRSHPPHRSRPVSNRGSCRESRTALTVIPRFAASSSSHDTAPPRDAQPARHRSGPTLLAALGRLESRIMRRKEDAIHRVLLISRHPPYFTTLGSGPGSGRAQDPQTHSGP